MEIINAIQDIAQQPIMDQWIIELLSTPGGFIIMLGIAIYLIANGVAKVISKQGDYFGAQAKEREIGTKGSELTLDMVNESFELYKRDTEKRSEEREKTITRLLEGQTKFQEELEFMKEQLNIQKGEKSALFETNKMLAQDNYKISTDLGVATESKSRLEFQIESLKAEVQRLTKAHNECNDETAKERAAYEAKIKELTAQIATLQSELAAKQEPIEAKVTVMLQGSEGKDTPAANENEAGKE